MDGKKLPVLLVKYPKEPWKKVNMSRLLSQFRKLHISTVVEVPEDEVERVVEILFRNNAQVFTIQELEDPSIVMQHLFNKTKSSMSIDQLTQELGWERVRVENAVYKLEQEGSIFTNSGMVHLHAPKHYVK